MSLASSIRERINRILAVVRTIVGVPDYDAYLRHTRAHHPETTPLGRQAFLQKCWEDKYTRPGNRCC